MNCKLITSLNSSKNLLNTQSKQNMQTKKTSVIALDLDGTLTNSKKEVTARTREALLQAEANGAAIVLASGRPTYGIMPVAECLEMQQRGGYILSYNGGKIIDCTTGEELYSKHLPAEVLPILHDYARTHHIALLGYVGKEIVTEMPNDEHVQVESHINKMPIRGVDNLLESIEAQPTKLLLAGAPERMAQAEKELLALVADKMEVFRSAPIFVELVPKGIDKAQSLARLLDVLHLSAVDLTAFGDGYNDLTMIRFAGRGVAMANAVPELRAEADYITLSNDEDGIAAFLEK